MKQKTRLIFVAFGVMAMGKLLILILEKILKSAQPAR
jgi:hypothetical protein